jgi:hypothetical protein
MPFLEEMFFWKKCSSSRAAQYVFARYPMCIPEADHMFVAQMTIAPSTAHSICSWNHELTISQGHYQVQMAFMWLFEIVLSKFTGKGHEGISITIDTAAGVVIMRRQGDLHMRGVRDLLTPQA